MSATKGTRFKTADPVWLVVQIGDDGWVKLTPVMYTQKDKVPKKSAELQYKKGFK